MAAPPTNPALASPLAPPRAPGVEPTPRPAQAAAGARFDGVLTTAQAGGVSFSNHALQRVRRRGIDVSPQTMARLSEGVARAAGKGARDSVVFVTGTAFVVSIANRTVITAVDSASMRDSVFTNIDSAVIA